MPSIYLIRHGQASSGQDNYDQLSALGYKQATRLGEVMSQRIPLFDSVCVGGMLRHKQTAENCLSGFGATLSGSEPRFDNGWNEYDHQDIMRQLRPEFTNSAGIAAYLAKQKDPKQAFEKEFNDAINRWISGEHDGDYVETWTEYTGRVHAALDRTLSEHRGAKSIAVFTSGGPISLVSQHLLGVPREEIMKLNWTLMNCGVTKLVATKSRMFVASLNEHGHFEGDDNKPYISYS